MIKMLKGFLIVVFFLVFLVSVLDSFYYKVLCGRELCREEIFCINFLEISRLMLVYIYIGMDL